ncbi:Lar family restriction alleviation protein [Bradyrhizobium sp. 13971]
MPHFGTTAAALSFCGGSEVWIHNDIDPKFVVCKECSAFGPNAPTVRQAAERWNKRTTP